MVAIAAQRNQNSAAGAITLLIAGFSASGIFGIDGVCTKLKYHSRPIHITPDITCSQRKMNAHQVWSPAFAPAPPAASIRMISRTNPAATVLPNDPNMACMLALLSLAEFLVARGENSSTPNRFRP